MSTYAEKVEIFKLKVDDLNKKIPVYVKALPDVKEGLDLQAEGLRLLDEMQQKLEGGEHGKC